MKCKMMLKVKGVVRCLIRAMMSFLRLNERHSKKGRDGFVVNTDA